MVLSFRDTGPEGVEGPGAWVRPSRRDLFTVNILYGSEYESYISSTVGVNMSTPWQVPGRKRRRLSVTLPFPVATQLIRTVLPVVVLVIKLQGHWSSNGICQNLGILPIM